MRCTRAAAAEPCDFSQTDRWCGFSFESASSSCICRRVFISTNFLDLHPFMLWSSSIANLSRTTDEVKLAMWLECGQILQGS